MLRAMVTAGWDGQQADALGPHWHNLGNRTERTGGYEKSRDRGHSAFRTPVMETVGGHQLTSKGLSPLSDSASSVFTWSCSSALSRLAGVCDVDISLFPFFVPGDIKRIAVTIWDLEVVRVGVNLMFPIPVMRLF